MHNADAHDENDYSNPPLAMGTVLLSPGIGRASGWLNIFTENKRFAEREMQWLDTQETQKQSK